MLFSTPVLLPSVARAESLDGSLLATLIIFAMPTAALAISGPFATRLLARHGRVGTASGMVSVLSTLGSVLGVFCTSFILVPRLGTQTTLTLFAATTIVVGTLGFAGSRPAMSSVLLALPLLPLAPDPVSMANDVWSQESAYNLVRVCRRGDRLHLVLNDYSSVQVYGPHGFGPLDGGPITTSFHLGRCSSPLSGCWSSVWAEDRASCSRESRPRTPHSTPSRSTQWSLMPPSNSSASARSRIVCVFTSLMCVRGWPLIGGSMTSSNSTPSREVFTLPSTY